MMQVCRNAADLFCQNSAGLEEFLNSKKMKWSILITNPHLTRV